MHYHHYRYSPRRSWTPWGFSESLQGGVQIRKPLYALAPVVLASATRAARTLLAAGGFDVVHVHWVVPNGPIGALAAPARRVPLVISLHGSDVAVSERSRAIGRATRWSFARAAAVTAPSDDLLERAARLGATGMLERVPYGADVGAFEISRGRRRRDAAPPGLRRGARRRSRRRAAGFREGLRVSRRRSRRSSRLRAAAPPRPRRRRRSQSRARGARARARSRRLRRADRSGRPQRDPRLHGRGGHRCGAFGSLRRVRRRPSERRARGHGRRKAARRVQRGRAARARARRRERRPRRREGRARALAEAIVVLAGDAGLRERLGANGREEIRDARSWDERGRAFRGDLRERRRTTYA